MRTRAPPCLQTVLQRGESVKTSIDQSLIKRIQNCAPPNRFSLLSESFRIFCWTNVKHFKRIFAHKLAIDTYNPEET